MAAARRLLLLAEQYLAAFDAHADYQTSPGAAARVIASSGAVSARGARGRCVMSDASDAMVPGQLAFDVDDLIRQAQLDRVGEWCGAPLEYTSDYYTPQEQRWTDTSWSTDAWVPATRAAGPYS